ncbi:gas vesicle protein [Nocardia sp. KC 131]|uniref:gas vesicle protein GvpO n=1 Tax=Nocardia arseniciresistens TaxID=3392119 RepID=UPI00398EC7E1
MARKTTSDDSEDVHSASDEQPPLTAAQAAAVVIEHLTALTSKHVQGVTCMEPTEDGWLVEIEVLEDRRIPSSADILALYEAEVDLDGNLLAYRRIKRYGRGNTDVGGSGRR